MLPRLTPFAFKIFCLTLLTGVSSQYYGKDLGRLSELHHAVKGHVYAVDGRTIFIKDFTYDGEGPAAFFYVGSTKTPSNTGAFRLRDERGSTGVLKRYRGKDITLSLPEGKTLSNIKWFSVWCDEFAVNFGDIKIPRNFEFPKPEKVAALSGVHGVSSDPIVIVDAQTLLIPNFSYDGEAPDAKFWVGSGNKPTPQGTRIPDENGKTGPLRRYDHKTIVLTLPGDLTVFDLGHFGVWCEAFTVDFGHIKIPTLSNVPPSLKMLGVSPQSKLNCEVLYDDLAFEVRWAVAGDSVVMQLVAKLEDGEYMSFGLSGDSLHSQMVGGDVTVAWVDKVTLKGYATDYYLDAKSQCAGVRGSCPDERLGEKTNSVRLLNAAMVNGYSIVTYQRPLKAADELDRAVQTNGSQPVIWAIGPLNSRNEVSYHSHFLKTDKLLEFGRPPVWNCPMPETEESQQEKEQEQIPANQTPSHGQFLTETTNQNQGQDIAAVTNAEYIKDEPKPHPVPTPKPVTSSSHWEIPDISCNEPEDGVFYAQMGPTGGKQGYSGITGHVGWGISWYINGLLIPEIHVVRGRSYNFVTEGGNDPDVPARFHPFYITDDPVGGYEHKTPEEKANTQIFAGVRRTRSGSLVPTGVGRLCNWTPDNNGPEADEFPSFGAFQRSLTLVCAEGEPGVVQWTPDQNTPDTVYYQCFTHRYLGWKIHVHDECDEPVAEASEQREVFAKLGPAESSDLLQGEEDLDSTASIQVATRIKPDTNFLLDHRRKIERDYLTKPYFENIENHNMNADRILNTEKQLYDDDTVTGEIRYNAPDRKMTPPEQNQLSEYDLPITRGQLKQVIDAVEHIESVKIQDDRHPVYQHSTQPTVDNDIPNSDLSIPERPIREDEELLIEIKDPSNMMLPPNQQPMTLQTIFRPNSKPVIGMNQYFRRPTPPEIKPRRPINGKPVYGMPPRYPPTYMNGQQGPIHPTNKKQHFKGNNNRLPMNGYGRPLMNQPFKNMGQNTPKPNFNISPMLTQGQSVIMGKPNMVSQTLTLGQPTIIGQHVVRTQMTLPSNVESSIQHSMHQSYLNKPGQIILGKPMENPMPLDQQMIPTKLQVVRVTGITTTTESNSQSTIGIKKDNEITTRYPVMESSELLSVSPASTRTVETLPPAINTGFKPDSIVIESGFKPIIREPLMEEEEKITDYVPEALNRRTDNDVSDQYEDNHQHSYNNNYHNDKITQSFEPIFIPSPPDRISSENGTVRQGINRNQYVEERPQPVYRPETPLEELFAEKSLNKNLTSDDLDVAADGINAFYLPPDNRNKTIHEVKATDDVAEGTVVTYDGHTVSASTLTSVSNKPTDLFSSKLSPNAQLLTKTPQFGPYKGVVPPDLNSPSPYIKENLSHESDDTKYASSHSSHFELLSALFGDLGLDKDYEEDLEPEHSEKHEVTVEDDDKLKEDSRRKRDVNMTQSEFDHSGHDHIDHDDSGHDHPSNDHSGHDSSNHDHHGDSGHNHSKHRSSQTVNGVSSNKYFGSIIISITTLLLQYYVF